MTIYIGPEYHTEWSKEWPWRMISRLTSNSVLELGMFATSLGLNSSWLRHDGDKAYYHLSPGMRRKAIRRGAVEVSRELSEDP